MYTSEFLTVQFPKRILKNPEVYSNISAKCEEAIECAESSGSHLKSYYLDGKYNPCMFFAFYHGHFSTCADTLIGKVGDQIPCIETVFHEFFNNETEKCEAYKNSQPCLVRAILNACDVMPEEGKMRKKQMKKDFYADEIYNFVPALCMDY
ncbi:hypothetical protein GCK72_018968 [Caenorhabditis remanei]|uniref:T20D4.11-like domain-containing protein n=1 Tax=Caenorhabditis remanei TaxID=31234 RepID=A0A6A5GCM1_CAERE|nr:hypothetical protein GCK72_018968 [Caenorhabditis remanei]KAF1752413.1 hypothetical protein GCK72_018968 [Caenorhabditis remanei]